MLNRALTTACFRLIRMRAWVLIAAILLPGAGPARGQAMVTPDDVGPGLHTAQIFDLANYINSAGGAPDTYDRIVKTAFSGASGDAIDMMTFEENRSFVYAVAGIRFNTGLSQNGGKTHGVSRLVRRFIVLDSSVVVVDDQVVTPDVSRANTWRLFSSAAPLISGREARIDEASGGISSEMLFPRNGAYTVKHTGGGQKSESHITETTAGDYSSASRFLNILRVQSGHSARTASPSQLDTAMGQWKLTVTTGNKIFRMTLPPPAESAGDISISTVGGQALLGSRLFPSGVLPHGPVGNRLMAAWDADYSGKVPAYWDIGRPADELQRVISEGKVRPCRVVDLCCGSGTDAIYLASKGFDVTAIDVAPTALSQAQMKARQAQVSVRWILADVLAPPNLPPFDFIYDRGCYHVVRDQNLAAYLKTIERFSRAGTQFLLLAARHKDQGTEASPGVSEEELRFDFLPFFDIEWLREIRLESNRQGIAPPGWSVMLKRNAAH